MKRKEKNDKKIKFDFLTKQSSFTTKIQYQESKISQDNLEIVQDKEENEKKNSIRKIKE